MGKNSKNTNHNDSKPHTKAKLILNPMAGDHPDPNSRLEEVTRYLLDHGIEVDVALAKPKKEATRIARKAVKDGYKLVIVLGGDGTIEATARGLVGSKTRLGILPGGTANNIAKSLGLPEDLGEACALIEHGHMRKVDVGQVKSKKKKKVYFFELVAVGLNAALYPQGKNLPQDVRQARLSALADVVKTLLGYKPSKMEVTLDKESHIEVESMLVTVSNTPAWGMNFLVAPNASMQDGLLDVMIYANFSKADLLAYFAKVSKIGYDEDPRVQRYRARKIKIKAIPSQATMADGIMLGEGTVKIRILPKALRIIDSDTPGLAQKPTPEEKELPAPLSPALPEKPTPKEEQVIDSAKEGVEEKEGE